MASTEKQELKLQGKYKRQILELALQMQHVKHLTARSASFSVFCTTITMLFQTLKVNINQ